MEKEDIIDRLRLYGQSADAVGSYAEAECAYDAIKEIERLREARAECLTTLAQTESPQCSI
jgi:hypothetical protein